MKGIQEMRNQKIFRAAAIAFIIAVFCLPALAQAAESTGQPKVVVDNPEYDWGSAYAGKTIVHNFVIRNEGDAPLEIKGVRAG
jgi:hypothetical protein